MPPQQDRKQRELSPLIGWSDERSRSKMVSNAKGIF